MIIKALPPLVDKESRILILGTAPGQQSITLQQYYGNRGNYFWKLMFDVFDEPFSIDYEARKAFLKKHKIALWNTLASCERIGSSDQQIRNPIVNDFYKFFEDYPNIQTVFFESISAATLYSKMAYRNEKIVYITLPSTSGLNARLSYQEKLRSWRQIADVF